MVKEVDKTRIKNWVVGDTFAWKINGNEYSKYNNRYILFTMIETPKTWNKSRTKKTMVVKLTKNESLPKTQNEYDALETIKMGVNDPVELANRLYEVEYNAKPDEFEYIYDYVFELWVPGYKVSNDMKYIGNFSFIQPQDSFIPQSSIYGIYLILFDKDFPVHVNHIIGCYEFNNLKYHPWFSEEYLKNRDKIRQDNIDFMNHLRKVSEEIEKKCKIYGCDTKKHRDTCTYVGPKKNRK